jgi:hypothetical protein
MTAHTPPPKGVTQAVIAQPRRDFLKFLAGAGISYALGRSHVSAQTPAGQHTPATLILMNGRIKPLIYICGYPPTTNLDNISVTYMACSAALIS